MNTSNLKKVAPKARIAFINAITARAAEFGITAALLLKSGNYLSSR